MRARCAAPFSLVAVFVLAVGCDDPYRRRDDRRRDDAFRARCGKIIDRIENDRSKINEIDPSEHPKARQWYIDDLGNAERDLDRCRQEY